MPPLLDPAREMLSPTEGWQLRVRIARHVSRDGFGTSVTTSAVAHVVAIAGLYVGSWLYYWANVGEWQVIPPQHGMSSAASSARHTITVAAPRVQNDEPLEDVVAMSAIDERSEPEELTPREIEISPAGELPVVAAATLEGVSTEPVSNPQAEAAVVSRRATAHEIEQEPQDDSPVVERDERTPVPTTLSAARAEAAPARASAASVASSASSGAQSVPSPVFNPTPVYPPELVAARIEGLVKLRVELSADGRVVKAAVSKSSGRAAFDRAALDVIYRWRFTASSVRAPTQRTLIVPIRFGIVE